MKRSEERKKEVFSVLPAVLSLFRRSGYLPLLLLKTGIGSLLPLIFVVFPAWIVEELTGAQRAATLAALLASMLLLHFFLGFFHTLLETRLKALAQRIDRDFLLQLAQRVMGIPYERLESTREIDRIRTARDGLNRTGGPSALLDRCGLLLQSAVTLCLSVAIVAGMDFWLILLAVASIAVHTLIQSRLKKIDMKFWDNMVGYNTRFFYVAGVILNRKYAKDIRVYDAKKTFTGQMDGFIGYIREEFRTKAVRQSRCNVWSYLMDALQQCFLYGYLGWQFLRGMITLGGFTMYAGAVQSFSSSAVSAMEQFLELVQICHFLKPGIELLEEPPAADPEKQLPCGRPALSLRDVTFRYENQNRDTLQAVSLEIPYGQKLCIVGMNGAGKTTLIKLLMGLYRPERGEVRADGAPLPAGGAGLFAPVFQDFKLLAVSVRENIAPEHPDDDRIWACLEQAGLAGRIRRMPHGLDTQVTKLFDPEGIDLSGGEAQKLAIARALYRDAPVLILDEPTSALDPRTESEIYTRFHQMVGDKTALYISHRMTSCLFSDRVAVFDQGRLVQYGAHEELLRQEGIYAKMFHAQAQYYQG